MKRLSPCLHGDVIKCRVASWSGMAQKEATISTDQVCWKAEAIACEMKLTYRRSTEEEVIRRRLRSLYEIIRYSKMKRRRRWYEGESRQRRHALINKSMTDDGVRRGAEWWRVWKALLFWRLDMKMMLSAIMKRGIYAESLHDQSESVSQKELLQFEMAFYIWEFLWLEWAPHDDNESSAK